MAIQSLYPTIKPSLNLDFANTKQLDPRITFTRTTTARYYDGKTVAKAEENLLQYSQEFDDAAWTKIGAAVTANTSVAPDGTTTAETLTATAVANIHAVRQSAVASDGKTASIFAKSGTNQFLQIFFDADSASFANFDLTAGTVGSTGAGVTASIVSVGNGWFRCICTTTSTTATNVLFSQADSSTAGRFPLFTAAGTETILLWGAQLEQRSSVTAYTPTTTQPITNYIPVLQTAAAGQARFDHNPVTGESLGLLIEEQRSNLLLRSEEFDNASWTKTNSTITANTVVAPDGALTGDKVFEDTTTNSHTIYQSFIPANATTYTASVYLKAAERTFAFVGFNTGSMATTFISVNLSAGTISTALGTPVATSITSVGNGWYRVSITLTSTGTLQSNFDIRTSEDGVWANRSYLGNGYSGIYIWGAQLEAGAFPTSYIKTEGSSVTRNADAASMTGANFSSWYRADEGTLFADGVSPDLTGRKLAEASNGTATSRILMSFQAVTQGVIVGGGTTSVCTSTSNVANAFGKTAFAYKLNDLACSVNAGSVGTDTSQTIPTVNRLDLGRNYVGTEVLNGFVRKLSYYPKRLTNAELQALTTV
jgi:hypothetical protein